MGLTRISEQRKGELYLFFEIVLASFFPIVTTLTYAFLPALLSLAWAAIFAAVFLGLVVWYKKQWHEILNATLWKYLFFITLFVAVIFYALYFIGLEKTTPGNAALIVQFEIFTTFFFFNILRREDISAAHIFGAALMILGVVIVLFPNVSGIKGGDFLILAATCATPLGNLYQQKARQIASSETIMFLRTAISIPCIFLLAYALHVHASAADIRASLLLLLVNGVLIFGLSKIFWLEAIHRISVTKAIALGTTAPFLTLAFAWILLHQTPTVWQVTSLVPLFFGTLLLTDAVGFLRPYVA